MNMTSDFKRRIHIEGQPNNPTGQLISIRDADTGEGITGVKSIVVYLDVREVNRADITYYEQNEHNQIVVQDGEPVINTTALSGEDVSLNITAFETIPATEETPHE